MKNIVKRILESGLVDKHTALLMERWGSLDRGASDMVVVDELRTYSQDQLVQFVEDIDSLLEKEREELKETRFSIVIGDPLHVRVVGGRENIVAFWDGMGNLLLPPGTQNIGVDDVLYLPSEEEYYDVCDVTPLYKGDVQYALQVDTKLLEKGNGR